MSAPEPIPLGSKVLIALGAAAVNAVLYLVPNHLQLLPATSLPWTRLDAAVPFIPVTVWIYMSDYFLVAGAFFFCSSWAEAKRFARAYFVLLLFGSTVHLLWPTTFPREWFPVLGDGVTASVFRLLRQIDLPTSCMPSMHVAGSYLAAFSLWRKRRAVFTGWTSWATAVAVSTLTAKQHYLVDVIAGALLAGAFWLLFFARESQSVTREPALLPR